MDTTVVGPVENPEHHEKRQQDLKGDESLRAIVFARFISPGIVAEPVIATTRLINATALRRNCPLTLLLMAMRTQYFFGV